MLVISSVRRVKTTSLSSKCQTREGSAYVCTELGVEVGQKACIMASAGLTRILALGHVHDGLIRSKTASGKSRITLPNAMWFLRQGVEPSMLDLPVWMEDGNSNMIQGMVDTTDYRDGPI